MTPEEKIAYIIAALDTPGIIHQLMKMAIIQAIPQFEEARLDVIIAVINA